MTANRAAADDDDGGTHRGCKSISRNRISDNNRTRKGTFKSSETTTSTATEKEAAEESSSVLADDKTMDTLTSCITYRLRSRHRYSYSEFDSNNNNNNNNNNNSNQCRHLTIEKPPDYKHHRRHFDHHNNHQQQQQRKVEQSTSAAPPSSPNTPPSSSSSPMASLRYSYPNQEVPEEQEQKHHVKQPQRTPTATRTIATKSTSTLSVLKSYSWLFGLLSMLAILRGGQAGFACLSNPCVFGVCIDGLNSGQRC